MALPSHFLCDSPKIAEIGFAITHSCSAHLRDEMRGDVGTQSVKELVLSYLLSSLGPHFPQLWRTLLAPPGRLILRAEKVGGKHRSAVLPSVFYEHGTQNCGLPLFQRALLVLSILTKFLWLSVLWQIIFPFKTRTIPVLPGFLSSTGIILFTCLERCLLPAAKHRY